MVRIICIFFCLTLALPIAFGGEVGVRNTTVVRRAVAPPPLPGVVGPGSPDRTEHVSAQNKGAKVLHCPSRELMMAHWRRTIP